MHHAAQERARRQHHARREQPLTIARDDAAHPRRAVRQPLDDEVLDGCLVDAKSWDGKNRLAHRRAVQFAVRLSARALDGRPLATVEHAEVDAALVDGAPHDAVQRIDLADEVALADPTDRRVARHLANRVDALRHEYGRRSGPCGRRGRLHARVAASDDDDVDGAAVGGVATHARKESASYVRRLLRQEQEAGKQD